jgi:hypothetical protein
LERDQKVLKSMVIDQKIVILNCEGERKLDRRLKLLNYATG